MGTGFVAGAPSVPPSEPTPEFVRLWHTKGRDGLACASCHTDTGREIWLAPFSRADMVRRAGRHLSTDEANALGEEFEKIRRGQATVGKIPFAPLDSPLPGSTAAERDLAFAARQKADGFPLLTQDIRTLDDAKRAAEQIRSVPLNKVPVGLPLDPISRDPFDPNSGPTLCDWIPDTARTEPNKSLLTELSRVKGLALAVFDDTLVGKPVTMPELTDGVAEHPIWAVGNLARNMKDTKGSGLGVDAMKLASLQIRPDEPLHMGDMALNWFWIGWTLDPDLQRMSRDKLARNGAYMSELLWSQGPYPFHALYFASRRPLELRASTSSRSLQPDWVAFVNNEDLVKYAPKDKEPRGEFVRGCRNLLRMSCLILEDDIRSGRPCRNPWGARQQTTALWKFLQAADTAAENARTAPIFESANRLLNP